MPTAKKQTSTSKLFDRSVVTSAKEAADAVTSSAVRATDWSKAVVTPGGGVAKTIAAIKRTRGPGKKPAKEQVALRLDPEVLLAFRSAGPGWQTRMNTALKEWLASRSSPPKRKAQSAV
jgi:uncharacterized protein (DUF4415 family)